MYKKNFSINLKLTNMFSIQIDFIFYFFSLICAKLSFCFSKNVINHKVDKKYSRIEKPNN